MAQTLTEDRAFVLSMLRNVQAFSSLEDTVLGQMADTATYQNVARGEVLITEGEQAETLYIVLKGRFVVLQGDTPIAEVPTGDPIGELAFFAGGTRTASVVAARNATVMCLTRVAYDKLAASTPELSNGILSALSQRLAKAMTQREELRPKVGTVCSVLPGGGAALDPRFAEGLRAAFDEVPGWQVLGVEDCPKTALKSGKPLTVWLDEQEASGGNLVLLCADPEAEDVWRKAIVDHSDTVLIAARKTKGAGDAVPASPLETELLDATLKSNIQLALYRDRCVDPTTDTARWLEHRDVALHHHIALDTPEDFARLARFIRGEAVGLVLCGGGSFGTAHLGAIEALRERGYSFDFIGGTSVGSAMAGALALGYTPRHILEVCEDLFLCSKAMSRLTVPKYAVLDHHRLDDALKQHFGGYNIEDLPFNFFAIATSLTYNDEAVLRRGPLWQAIRASTSVPGAFPPFIADDGEVLIDGGLLDNVPVTVMRDLKSGPNLVLNFHASKPWRAKAKYEHLPTRGQALRSLLIPRKRRSGRPPSIFSILSRTMVVNSRRLLQHTEMGNDVLLNVSTLRGMNFMSWTRGREQFDAAYKEMSEAMAQSQGTDGESEMLRQLSHLRAAAAIANVAG